MQVHADFSKALCFLNTLVCVIIMVITITHLTVFQLPNQKFPFELGFGLLDTHK
jgi:hypothetical protein